MIKRTIEISQEMVHLTARNEQLLVLERDGEQAKRLPANPSNLRASIPCEDIGVLLVEHTGTTYTHAALERLIHHGAAVVICGKDHLPCGMLLPIGEHSQVVPRIHSQMAISKPLRKQLWKQLIQAKVRAQATNLPDGSAERSKLLALARSVRSGDPNNVEAQAARIYWPVFFDDVSYRRDPGGAPPNNLLNYGYAIMRAAVARAIVAAGLLPAVGLHHHNRSNAFCLADDLIEPLRPIVDDRVRELHRQGHSDLLPPVKASLLELLTLGVECSGQTGPLMVALHRMIASLVQCYEGERKHLTIPVVAEPQG